jgi:Flp pilus assembly protein protease CpaA
VTNIGVSLFAIALGAILKFAVTAHVAGIRLSTVGVILMVVGGIGLCVGVWLYMGGRGSQYRARRR